MFEDEPEGIPKIGAAIRLLDVVDAAFQRFMIKREPGNNIEVLRKSYNRDPVAGPRGIDEAPGRRANQFDFVGSRAGEIQQQHQIERRLSRSKERNFLRLSIFENCKILLLQSALRQRRVPAENA